jgi:gamma-glutamylcyclotransferase
VPLYFAYGSNMEPATFRGRRGIEPLGARGARAAGWRLVLDKPPLVPIGEAFANIVPDAAGEVFGVLWEVTEADLAHVDLTEGVLIGNYHRVEIEVEVLDAPHERTRAFTLVSEKRDGSLRPSRRYMACLIAGALEHGLPAAWIERLRAVEAAEESPAAAVLRPMLDSVLRKTRP